MMKLLFINILFLAPILCMGQKCKDLPNEFTSYADAMSQIYKSHFNFINSRSETIQSLSEKKNFKLVSASYYSCDKITGIAEFIFINRDIFLYEKIPMTIWNEYNKCISTDLYYENNILTKYRCIFKQLGSSSDL